MGETPTLNNGRFYTIPDLSALVIEYIVKRYLTSTIPNTLITVFLGNRNIWGLMNTFLIFIIKTVQHDIVDMIGFIALHVLYVR